MGIFLFIILTVGCAIALYSRMKSFWLPTLICPLASTLVWFALTMTLALTDGWGGWEVERPTMIRALLLCLQIALPVAMVTGGLTRGAMRVAR